jgi:hypothetical protein
VQQSTEEEERTEEAPKSNRPAQPREVATGERGFPGSADSAPPEPERAETETGAEVEQPGQHLGREIGEQALGQGGTAAEEEGGEEGRLNGSIRSLLHRGKPDAVKIPASYRPGWSGQYEALERVKARCGRCTSRCPSRWRSGSSHSADCPPWGGRRLANDS